VEGPIKGQKSPINMSKETYKGAAEPNEYVKKDPYTSKESVAREKGAI